LSIKASPASLLAVDGVHWPPSSVSYDAATGAFFSPDKHKMPTKNGARSAQPMSDAERRARDAERKRRAYWANPERARAQLRAKRQRNLDRCRAQQRARYWRHVEKERARARERARSARGREINRKAVARYRQSHGEIVAAQHAAYRAMRRGELKVALVCEVKDCRETAHLHLHHPRYDRPRDVIRTCRDLHHRGPLELKPGAGRKWARAPRREA
jgi:hypothetical protein